MQYFIVRATAAYRTHIIRQSFRYDSLGVCRCMCEYASVRACACEHVNLSREVSKLAK